MAIRDALENCVGFDWAEDNEEKNWDSHGVALASWPRSRREEAEDVFFHEPLVVHSDVPHSKREKRYYALGQTETGRMFLAAFTIRRQLIRVISVRDMSRNEREIYGRQEEESSS